MSLMSDTQGTPERVWSLVRLLGAHGGEMPRHDVKEWLDPLERDTLGTAVANTIGAASSLGLVSTDNNGKSLRLEVSDLPRDIDCFSDWVHDRLAKLPGDDSDAIVLAAF